MHLPLASFPTGLRHVFTALAAALFLVGCGDGTGGGLAVLVYEPVEVPSVGSPGTFDVATWNVSWLGDTENGPADEALQLQRVREVLLGADVDLWALQEVVSEESFRDLLDGLPGFSGLLADDPSVRGGPEAYSGFGDREQKVALVYRSDRVSVREARVILAKEDFAFAGRPPLEVEVTVQDAGRSRTAVVVVFHAKASDDLESWTRRRDASLALERHLDEEWPLIPVWVLGDFNDDIDESITPGRATPYENFVDDPVNWRFATRELSTSGRSSTVFFEDMVDHQLISDEVVLAPPPPGPQVYDALEGLIARYADTTSDHFPVVVRYLWP